MTKGTQRLILKFLATGINRISIMADRNMPQDAHPILLVSYKQYDALMKPTKLPKKKNK